MFNVLLLAARGNAESLKEVGKMILYAYRSRRKPFHIDK